MQDSNKFGDFLKFLVKAYQHGGDDTVHRVVDYHKNHHGEYDILIQVIGVGVVFKMAHSKIMADSKMLESFSKKDIRFLTYLAHAESNQPRVEVLSQKFIRNLNQFFFKLRHRHTGQEIEQSAEAISANRELIKSLPPEEAHKIGYVTANEQIKRESNFKKEK